MMSLVINIAALLALVCVPLCWQLAQQNKRQKSARLSYIALSLVAMVVSLWLWSSAYGLELSVFFVLFHITWLTYLVLVIKRRVKSNGRKQNFVNQYPAETSTGYKFLVMLLAGPVALFASILVAFAVSLLIFEQGSNQWVLMFMLVPLVWGIFSVWLAADNRLLRPLASLLILTLLSWLMIV